MKIYVVIAESTKDPFPQIINELELIANVVELDPVKFVLGRIADMRKETSDG